ncbi:MAG: histidine kinase [Ignavibacteriaceae bacterium]|nr:histidine kinase [Ignavibacteriaceae bacterium]
MTLKSFVFVFCVSFFITIYLLPQSPSFLHYNTTHGLASTSVYKIFQDRDGFIWFCTTNGLNKFDGKTFETFTITDGLNSNSITDIVQAKNGDLYVANHERGINVIKNGKIENRFLLPGGKQYTINFLDYYITPDNESVLVASGRWSVLQRLFLQNDSIVEKNINNPKGLELMNVSVSGEDIFMLTRKGLYQSVNDSSIKVHIKDLPESPVFSAFINPDKSIYLGSNGKIYLIKNESLIRTIDISKFGTEGVSKIFVDKSGNIWFALIYNGIFCLEKKSGKIFNYGEKLGIDNIDVNSIIEDNEGNIWLSTYGKGVFCIRNLYLNTYAEKEGLKNLSVNAVLPLSDDKMLIGTFNGVNLIEPGSVSFISEPTDSLFSDYIYDIKMFDGEIYITGSFAGKKHHINEFRNQKFFKISHQSFCKTKNELFISGLSGNSIAIRKSFTGELFYELKIFDIEGNSNRVNDVIEDRQNNLWVSTNFGLCKLVPVNDSNDSLVWKKFFFPESSVLNSKINSSSEDANGNIYFAGEKGISIIFKNNPEKPVDYSVLSDYDLSSSKSIAVDSKNRVWIANLKGLFVIDGNKLLFFNSTTGLPANEIFKVHFDDKQNKIFAGTANGLITIDLDLFDKVEYAPPIFKILSVSAGDKIISDFTNLQFSHDNKNIKIDFGCNYFGSDGNLYYKYDLNGSQEIISGNSVNFASLSPGDYNFSLQVKTQNSNWSEPVLLSFKIHPPFYETLWFRVLATFFFFLVASIFVMERIRTNRKKFTHEIELNERINQLKHQALSAMMNPHFVFNALNSVQYLINMDKNEEANVYVSMMAKLMRKNLDTADKAFILLDDEINRLKLYLELEKLRFQEKFSYKITTENIPSSEKLMIPNMIIQPFVENSLWHGIMNSGKPGKLEIIFNFEEITTGKRKENVLTIRILDNGIGFMHNKEKKDSEHISKGIKIIEERLDLLKDRNSPSKPVQIKEILNTGNLPEGTEVKIVLSPPLYYLA